MEPSFYLGNEDCDEKWAAPKQLIERLEIEVAPESKSFASCSEAAKALLQLPKETLACAVISSYAAPLLEGCGTIKKGDLKIVGQPTNCLLSQRSPTSVYREAA